MALSWTQATQRLPSSVVTALPGDWLLWEHAWEGWHQSGGSYKFWEGPCILQLPCKILLWHVLSTLQMWHQRLQHEVQLLPCQRNGWEVSKSTESCIYWFLLERNTIYFSVISKDGKSNPNFNPNLSLKSEKGIFSPKDLNRKTFRNLTLLSLLGVVSQKQLFKGAGSFLYTSQALYRRVLPPCMGREWGAPRKRTRTRVNWIEVFPGFLCRF